MRFLLVLGLTGCVTPHVVAPPAAPVVASGSGSSLGPVDLDDAAILAKSHGFFDAFDRYDLASLTAAVGPAFVLFEYGRFYDLGWLTKRMQSRLDRHAPVQTRVCKDEKVYRGGGVATYIGDCIDHVAAEGENAAVDEEGWNTLIWAHDGESWKVAHWQWQKAGLAAERELWNDRFKQPIGFKVTANQLLIDTVKGRKPGTALDVAMGQGRNAVFLATQGWKVTGVDISDEGMKVAQGAAAKLKVKLETVNADVATYDLGKERWDLVTLIYAGDDEATLEKIKPSLKKGGLFVVEFFAKEATAGTGIGGFAPGQLAGVFAGWKILKDEQVEDVADWTLRKTKLARFVAEKP